MGFDSLQGRTFFLYQGLSLGVKRLEREADHSPPSNADVKECLDLYLHSPIRLRGVVLSYNIGPNLPLAFSTTLPTLGLTGYKGTFPLGSSCRTVT
jgi:hypothetical protein